MHYYQHHIGDFDAATRHLTRLERSIYRDLIELYYSTESALPLDLAYLGRKIAARSDEELAAMHAILAEYFHETPAGWFHDRCEEEIDKFRKCQSQASAAGKASAAARAERRKAAYSVDNSTDVQRSFNKRSTDVVQNVNSVSTNYKPITNNHKPEDQNHVESEDSQSAKTKNPSADAPVAPDAPTPPKAPADDRVTTVFTYWQTTMGKPRAQLDAKRKRAIAGRLKDGYTVEQLCKAIDGCKADAFSMGHNDRQTPYNDVELICRDGSKVDRFIANADRAINANGFDHRMQAQIDELKRFVAEGATA